MNAYTHPDYANVSARDEHRDYGVADRRGRAVGGMATVGDVTFVKSSETGGYPADRFPLGSTRYYFKPHGTRDGWRHGPSQREQWFDTAAKRDAALSAYFAKAAAQARKKHAA